MLLVVLLKMEFKKVIPISVTYSKKCYNQVLLIDKVLQKCYKIFITLKVLQRCVT